MSKFSRIFHDIKYPLITRPTQFFPREAQVIITEYNVNGAKAIVGVDTETEVRLWTATVNLPDCPPNEGCVWIDNNGRNSGLMDELIRLGVIRFNDRFARAKTGYVFECALML